MVGTLLAVSERVEPRRRRVLGLDHEQRRAMRRRLVLDAALELFCDPGYARCTIEALCAQAGVGTNSFYESFSSKEDVLVALYDELTAGMRDAVVAAFAHDPGSADRIRPLVDAFVHAATDDPRIAQLTFVHAAGVSPRVEAHRRATRNAFVEGLEAIGRDLHTDAGAPLGAPPGPTSRRWAVAVVGAIIEMTVDWLHDPEPDPVDRLVDDIAHVCRVVDAATVTRR